MREEPKEGFRAFLGGLGSRLLAFLDPGPNREQRGRQVPVGPGELERVHDALMRDYFPTFSTWDPDYLTTVEGQRDLRDHETGRLESDRRTVVPWLSHSMSLQGATVLEIGAGTGSSTAALAEQGATVIAVDVNGQHLRVAKARCDAMGLDAEFGESNGADVHRLVGDRRFDLVIFFATMEHMTLDERIEAIRTTFPLVRPGGCWSVVEAPNRLWYFDSHTSGLPFFMWLPDELAKEYRRFSPRREFSTSALAETPEASDVAFARWGRGFSFHELELALGPLDEVQVVSTFKSYQRRRNPLRLLKSFVGRDDRHQRFLRRASGRDLHEGYFEPYLNLIIRKR
jgi:2-polyprenyl-3-methyl-5-hydroxy-6-metoxy-1,4-benzoquinol methylase